MLTKTKAYALKGLEGQAVEIEVDLTPGVPAMEMVGLPDAVVKESKDRVRSAIINSGFDYPIKRITINFAPAETKKEGAIFDLPVAIGILSAYDQIPTNCQDGYVLLGELSLDGSLRKINGLMAILISGLQNGYKKYIVPKENQAEASFVDGIEVYPASNLSEVVNHLSNVSPIPRLETKKFNGKNETSKYGVDFADVKGQLKAQRALEIAVAGGEASLVGADGREICRFPSVKRPQDGVCRWGTRQAGADYDILLSN